MLYRDEGIVLRTQKLGEADRIITLLLRERGIVRAAAKGVRRTSSKFGARLEPFSVLQLQLYTGRTLDTVTQAESLAMYGAQISADFEKYVAASVITETAEKLCDDTDDVERQYGLLAGALRTLAKSLAPTGLVRDSYLLRALSLAGWEPELGGCVVCGAAGLHPYIALAHGGTVCQGCKEPGAIIVQPETLALITALTRGNWAVAGESSERARAETASFVQAYTSWQLERGIKSAHIK